MTKKKNGEVGTNTLHLIFHELQTKKTKVLFDSKIEVNAISQTFDLYLEFKI